MRDLTKLAVIRIYQRKEGKSMNNLFNLDNPVMQFLSRIFDLVVLNVIFLIFCIPVVTIGASLSGLYYVSLKLVRGEEPYIWRNFFKAFRQNFRQGTVIWILLAAAAVLLRMDFQIINALDTGVFAVVRVLLWVISGVLFCVFLYIFPVISHFVCSTKQAFKNAFLMIIGFLPYTAAMLIVCGVLLALCMVSAKTFALVIAVSGLCGYSVIAFIFCIFFDRIFCRYEPKEDTKQED